MEDRQRYSLSYRAAETRQVMDWVRAGQCGCVVGLRGAGKSNFVRFLLRADVQQSYLGQDQAHFAFVLVNLLSLTERSEWGVYEMMLNNLLEQLCPPDIADEIILETRTLHQETMRTRDVLSAQRAVERCMALLCQQPTRRFVFLFDEFDAVFRELPASLFRCLRAMRDAHKGQVSYLVVATHDLAGLRDDLGGETDHFYRLVTRNPCWLGPYSEADARLMIDGLASRRSLELGEEDTKRVLQLSGGHAGLLKAILSLLWNEKNSVVLTPTLAKDAAIVRECRRVWGGLSDSEQAALRAFSNGERPGQRMLDSLAARGLLQGKGNAQTIFSPLLTSFAREQAAHPRTGTHIDRSLGIAQIEGRRIGNLTELEFELLCYLYEHRGRICTKNDLIECVYRQQYNFGKDGLSDEMLQALVSRLRKKIETEPGRPRYIATARGEGYRFVAPDSNK